MSETPAVLLRLMRLLQKDILETTAVGKNGIEVTYEDGERIMITIDQIDRPRGEVLN